MKRGNNTAENEFPVLKKPAQELQVSELLPDFHLPRRTLPNYDLTKFRNIFRKKRIAPLTQQLPELNSTLESN